MPHTPTPAAAALNGFRIDGYHPFMDDPGTVTDLLRHAHGVLMVVERGFSLSQGSSPDNDFANLNHDFFASAMGGVAHLIAMAMFLREQAS